MELLFYSMFCSVFSAFIPVIVKIVLSQIYRVSQHEIQLQREIVQLKRQMNEISMIDEFAKHAKLQRKLIKYNDELKTLENGRLTSSMKQRFTLTYVLYAVMSIVLLYIVWFNRNKPVIVFPEERLWPIASLLSWPTGVSGAVSVPVWIFLTNKMARMLAAYLT